MSTSRKAPWGFASLALVLAAFVLVPAAQADPNVTLDDVKKAFHKAAAANEKLNAVNVELEAAEAEIADLKKDTLGVKKEYDERRAALAGVIVQQQMDAPLGPTVNLLGSEDPQEFLDGLSAIQAYNTSQADALEAFGKVAATYEARQDRVEKRRAELTAVRANAAAKRAEVDKQYDKAKAAFDRLSGNDQEAFRTAGGTASFAAPKEMPKVNGPVAQAVVAYVYAQVGKPYCRGGDVNRTGGRCFDCSGLAYSAYRAAGVSIPRTPPYGNLVPLSEIQPGDLLWTYSHVAVYIGGGKYIEAANYSVPVRVGSLNGGWFKPAFASRFG